jgi:hypothetical protein
MIRKVLAVARLRGTCICAPEVSWPMSYAQPLKGAEVHLDVARRVVRVKIARSRATRCAAAAAGFL